MNITNGVKNEIKIHSIAAPIIVNTEAFFVIATQATDSPYVVLGHPPKNAPIIEPTPSPSNVLSKPGSVKRSFSIILEIFLWSAICSANTTKDTGMYATATVPIYPRSISLRPSSAVINVKSGILKKVEKEIPFANKSTIG